MSTPKALVIGIDGVRYDTLLEARTPRLDALAADGFLVDSPLYPRQQEPTVSGPGWSSVATGVWPDRHLVRDNTLAGNDLASHPDFLTRLTRAGRRTFAGLGWAPLGEIFGKEIDARVVRDAENEGFAEADLWVLADAVEQLGRSTLDAAFVYIGAVDECGQENGTGPAYTDALEQADEQVGLLVGAVRSRGTYADENWLVLVVTDHGHVDAGGHGGQSEVERTSWLLASGGGVARPERTVEVVDIAPTVLTHLGVPIDADWQPDGTAL